MKIFYVIILMCAFAGCGHPDYKNPHVIIKTGLGDIEVELYPGNAPKTVAAFLSYVDEDLYHDAAFYRVLKGEELPVDYNTGIIQGGIYLSGNNRIGKIKPIPHESTKLTGLSHTSGMVSFARLAPGTATTEFFICIGDQSALDAGRSGTPDGEGYAAFGKVFKGMSIVRKLQNQESHGDRFDEKTAILSIKRL